MSSPEVLLSTSYIPRQTILGYSEKQAAAQAAHDYSEKPHSSPGYSSMIYSCTGDTLDRRLESETDDIYTLAVEDSGKNNTDRWTRVLQGVPKNTPKI